MRALIRNSSPTAAALLLLLLGPIAALADEPTPRVIELWPDGAPGASGATDEDRPAITPYLPAREKSTGAGVLICPGGGFMTRAVDHEGVLIARWFQRRGVAGFVLRYRIRPIYGMEESLQDGHRGLRYLRAHADEFRIDPDRIGIIGFSAGAALAGNLTLKPQPGDSSAKDTVDREPSRAAFQVLVYGSAGRPRDARDGAATAPEPIDWSVVPPTFFFGTTEDTGSNAGMVEMYSNLAKAKIPAEAHFFAHGVHGVGFALGDPVLGVWPDLMWTWLRAGGFLADAPRVAVRGVVTVDGEPLARGVVILTPADSETAPPVVAYVTNTGPVRGEFEVPASQGPTPGRYRVEVRQDATRWMSNSRDPVFSRMVPKARDGSLTDDERKEWIAYARKRDLSPSIDDQRVYRHGRPGDRDDWTVEIRKEGENRLDLAISSR